MDAWNQEHHTKSGLVKAVRESTVSLKDAEKATTCLFTEACSQKLFTVMR